MKLNKLIYPVLASALLLGSCYDDKMEWGTPDGHYDIDMSDIPLSLKEKLANYKFIKEYVAQYTPHMTLGVGLGADLYISDAAYRKVTDDNFQMITTGNAMKHHSVVKTNGDLSFDKIDDFLYALPADMKVYGHNFIWHTQQKQAYLKSIISPEIIIEADPDDVCENIITNSDFEDGTLNGWGSWGNGSSRRISDYGEGYEGGYCMILTNPTDASSWSAQAAWDMTNYLEVGATYVFQFMAKSTSPAGSLQVQVQNSDNYGNQHGYNTFDVGESWILCQHEFECAGEVNRILINFGAIAGDYYIDNFKFGKKIEERMINILGADGKFEDGTLNSWGGWGNNSTREISELGEGYNSDYCMVMTNPTDADSWSAQTAYGLPEPLTVGKTYMYSAMVKATAINPDFTFQVQNSSSYSGQGYVSAETVIDQWIPIEGEFTCTQEGMDRLCINFGKVAGVYYIDNIMFGEVIEPAAVETRAGGVTYKYKTPEEKKEILLGAMEYWIKGMLDHVGSRIQAWDVINEPITDNCQWRGINGNFMSNGDGVDPDTHPVEDNGLNLNWADDHFYWGYYIGQEYATKAFEYARRYAPAGTTLWVNDYNLETNPNKLAALIEFVQYIENNGQTVDGIGTQMHINATSITRAQVDAMFKTMAATGKRVRVTELDVTLKTASPSASQLELQAEVYQMVFDSFRENVPTAQQDGITIWTLTDHKREHEYWLPDDAPNIFDANYGRKHAYKGVCDGIAGRDISEDFTGDDWQNAYTSDDEEETETEE